MSHYISVTVDSIEYFNGAFESEADSDDNNAS